ncbi:hypothetical protein ODU07_03490 [Streptococcus suis]|nr:hypothetical protein [Streptococcus suis]
MKRSRLFISILATIAILILGGCGMTSQKETLKEERQIAKKIAKDFSSKYLAPDKNEITTITFYQEPVVSNDATGNVTYKFYINDNSEWKVGASVKEQTGEIWAYGSDYIDLVHSEQILQNDDLTIKLWEQK